MAKIITVKRGVSRKQQASKIVGYSLGACVAVAIILVFLWLLIAFYDITLVIDSDTHLQFQRFFDIIYFIFVIIIGFAVFPPVFDFALQGIYLFRNKKKKKGILYLIEKNKNKIIYSGAIGYWFLYIIGLSLYFTLYLTK